MQGGTAALTQERAFSDVDREHSKAVFSFAVRVGGDARAEDVTQEVFLKLWRGALIFDPARGSLRTFLLSVARKVSVDQHRSATNRRAREDRDARAESRALVPGPESDAAAGDLSRRVVDALAQLSSERRAAIVLAFFGGISYREVATVLGEAEETVKSRIRAGLKQLRPLLN